MFNFDEAIQFENKKNDVLTVGELLVDMISNEYGDATACSGYTRHFGGSPSNIAINVGKLGIRSHVASAVGRDSLGSFLINTLQNAGMDISGIQQVEESTSMVVITKSQATPVPIFYRAADCRLEYNRALEQALVQSRIVHFSCWPVSRQPSRNTMERVIAAARKHKLLIGFDPNYHPAIWQQGEDGAAYVKAMIPQVDIIKPSEDDATRLFGPGTPEEQMARFQALGAKLVILTLGKDGALVSNGQETLALPTKADRIEDTTGAGDAFWSGFYTAVVKGYTLREALESGLAVSAYKLKYTGAVVELPALEAIQKEYNL
ncbi:MULTISPECIES: sugar kinase [unclassified Paenibacillus]|uniref:carbohydrate kinase family protein n=1 Tax=unclassified Paenibacillus TaxID=185978 RepID=UPI00240523C3|nr:MULTISPECIES: sugar kinase [unclassified Paenibacillus]MDF9843641.1 fructokinase [Paenibacillus sp. PastF-2]MDF9850229.1 fructokinase [Paenibacillus sp. PastM-2]MDF9856831.1 fructokinase [Paenibacillus sp. PastF-1]MDH6482076.1 fructokinase [Paenibacillus sp. PastH-2]MDH6509499.1 fructokinase [Paenibacillus sp. PastM-3]